MERWTPYVLLPMLGLADQEIAAGWTGNGSAHQQQILFAIDFHDPQILDGFALVPHVPGEMLPGPHPRRERTRANASGRAMEHGAVQGIPAPQLPPLDSTSKSFALAH